MQEEQRTNPVDATHGSISSANKVVRSSKGWENFLMSIICVLVLPLIPVIHEWIRGRYMDTADLMLTASMYAIGVGIASTSRLIFIITIVIGIIHAATYGEFRSITKPSSESEIIAYIAIAFVFLIHMVERYYLHVVQLKSWEFPGGDKK
jgi:hypothetical protein